MQRDIGRRLDELELALGARGIGEGFCECGGGVLLEHVVKLMGGDSADSYAAWEELSKCKSEVHNPRRRGLFTRPPDLDATTLKLLGGEDGVSRLIDELAKVEVMPATVVSPWVPAPPVAKEPSLPERIAKQIATPPNLADMLLLPEEKAAAGKRALERAWGVDSPEPEPEPLPVKAAIDVDTDEPLAKTKREPVLAVHTTLAEQLSRLLERTKECAR